MSGIRLGQAPIAAATGGGEVCATNSMSCAERADLGRRDRRPEQLGRALMPDERALPCLDCLGETPDHRLGSGSGAARTERLYGGLAAGQFGAFVKGAAFPGRRRGVRPRGCLALR
jgi:hypothetical protein